MDDLDLLKKDWQKLANFNQVSEADIYVMLHKKSSSIVKWLLIVSILEFIFWTIINQIYDTDEYFKTAKQRIFVEVFSIISYVIILIFIFLLFKNYLKITTTVTTKQLMTDILKTKKIINYYVFYNLAMIVLGFIASIIYLFFMNPENQLLKEKILNNPKSLFVFVITFVGMIGLFLLVFWLFYKVLYGLLLKKLYTNYEELKKIDL